MARSVRLRRTPPVFRHISPDLYITLEFRQGYCENRPVLRQKQSISPGEGRPFSCAGGTRPEHDELMRSRCLARGVGCRRGLPFFPQDWGKKGPGDDEGLFSAASENA